MHGPYAVTRAGDHGSSATYRLMSSRPYRLRYSRGHHPSRVRLLSCRTTRRVGRARHHDALDRVLRAERAVGMVVAKQPGHLRKHLVGLVGRYVQAAVAVLVEVVQPGTGCEWVAEVDRPRGDTNADVSPLADPVASVLA